MKTLALGCVQLQILAEDGPLDTCPHRVRSSHRLLPDTYRQATGAPGLNLSIKDAVYEDMETLTSGDAEKTAELPDLVADGRISADTIWALPVARGSRSVRSSLRTCPRIIQMRQHKVMMEGDISPSFNALSREWKTTPTLGYWFR